MMAVVSLKGQNEDRTRVKRKSAISLWWLKNGWGLETWEKVKQCECLHYCSANSHCILCPTIGGVHFHTSLGLVLAIWQMLWPLEAEHEFQMWVLGGIRVFSSSLWELLNSCIKTIPCLASVSLAWVTNKIGGAESPRQPEYLWQ